MPYSYSNYEYADMVFVYGFCNGSANAAVEEYRRRYPNRKCPNVRTFYQVFQHLRDKGRFPGIGGTAERTREHGEVRQIVHAAQHSPHISTRRISHRLGVSHMKAWRVLRSEGLRPYHLHKAQHLQDGDSVRRLQFCEWL